CNDSLPKCFYGVLCVCVCVCTKLSLIGVLRQMEKFLKGQEIRFTEGLRIMKSKLASLQNSVSKLPQADESSLPAHGRKFGSKYLVGHEVHFICSQGYNLAGSGSRVCQEDGSWSGVNAVCKDVNQCGSSPCQNGGSCVEGAHQYKCTCPQNWSGTHCQHQTQTAPPEWSVMNDPAFSRKPRCAKVDRAQHCSCDAGFHMSGTTDNSICQDVNECEVYKMERGGQLCAHECVNIPGSYHCSCPRGYKLLQNGRSCEDVDECLTQQHNCTHGTTCINTGGSFQCISPECPPSEGDVSYVKTSALGSAGRGKSAWTWTCQSIWTEPFRPNTWPKCTSLCHHIVSEDTSVRLCLMEKGGEGHKPVGQSNLEGSFVHSPVRTVLLTGFFRKRLHVSYAAEVHK
uniref:Fibulin 7 n=1 Tax=Denticeps clupeoides TaxID=299321 RepID=A0AAY4E1M8_9TELE